MKKTRIDVLLVEKGFFDSREKAKKNIMAGLVFANGQKIDKPGTKIDTNVNIEIKGDTNPYVSRGGLKLQKALEVFDIKVDNKIAADIGASTGGFTDCLLQNGASKVYAIDVGYGQLDWKLRNDPRVIVLEKVNARYLKPEIIDDKCHIATIDVSFISLKKVMLPVKGILKPKGDIIALIKPQFEAGPEKVGKKGVIRDKDVHIEVLKDVIHWSAENGFCFKNLTYSPVKGGSGNIEFLAHWTFDEPQKMTDKADKTIVRVVREAHSNFK